MINKPALKFNLTVLSCLILSACGGGGGSSSASGQSTASAPPPPPAFTVSEVDTPSIINEDSSVEIIYNFTGAQGDVTSNVSIVSSEVIDVTATDVTNNAGSTIFISMTETEYMGEEFSLNVTFTDADGRSRSFSHDIEGVNTSGEIAKDNHLSLVDAATNYLDFTDENLLFDRLVTLISMLPGEETEQNLTQFNVSPILDDIGEVEEMLGDSKDLITDYEAGVVTEGAFTSFKNDMMPIVNRINSVNLSLLNELALLTNGLVPEINDLGLYMTQDNSTLSPFIGHPELGEYNTDNQWTFNPAHQYLSDVVFVDELSCNIE